jgi:NDP-sugar pyrophosphorylase family protein
MQIVIPMAGEGKRFRDAGYDVPKPLIEVDGKPFIEYVVDFFPGETDFVFICNNEHLAASELGSVLRRLCPKGKVVGIDLKKLGPVESILEAKDSIKDDEPTVVTYCDFNIAWDYADFKKTVTEKDVDSAALCYTGFHPHLLGPNVYAGVRADAKNFALEVKEKFSFTANKMDGWHQAGLFYFKSGAMLKKYSALTLAHAAPVRGEYYVSLLYDIILKDGLNSLVYPVKYFCQWGTPEDLAEYLEWARAVRSGQPFEVVTAAARGNRAEQQQSFNYWKSYLS